MSKTYIEIIISPLESAVSDELIAFLADQAYESFVEEPNILKAYIEENLWDKESLENILSAYKIGYQKTLIEPQNWNAMWESSFEPVIINEKVAVRAGFHEPVLSVQYNLIVTPKMSFGTGHHSTTHLMLSIMSNIDWQGLKVLDYGTGTGVLAIYAEKLGAKEIIAIDIDTWCIENTTENIALNNCHSISTILGDLDENKTFDYDMILANINLHILAKQMSTLKSLLAPGGKIILSGILKQDEINILEIANEAGLQIKNIHVRNEWLALELVC